MDRILLMETSEEGKKKYEKKFKCPYCDNRYTRKQLPNHIDNVHHDLIPEGYTALRVAFNAINNKTEGHCVICGAVTAWNEEKGRYERLCGKQSCHDQYVKIAKERMRKKYGTDNMLQDSRYAAEQQKKMLANRKISGEYLFPDGGKVGYVGSYEKNFLHFMDKVMHIESTDIESPAPTIVYQFEGQAHMYIPDFLYVPYNLIIEIKDGGDNPNNRPMEEYREKIKAKEDAIIKAHKYNYIRLTNNDFSQLMEIFAVLKYTLDENPDQIIVRINESTLLESTNESISKYKRISIDDKSISQYKSDAKYLSHLRIGKDYKGYIWIDGSKVVAATNVNITTKMIQAIEISKEYQGKGLSYSILDIDTKELGATDLSVNKKNATAIHIYKKYGFKIYDEDDTMYYMSLNSKKKNTNESLNESTTLNEAYLRNLPDIYYNKDKFDSGEINFCIITGLSGSGKTTMGRSYQDKKNTQVYELDDLLCIKDHFTMNDLREYGDIIYKFFSGPGKKYYVGDKDGSLDRALKSTLHNHYEDKMFKDFVDYAKQYAKSNKNEKIILEGVWFYVPECGFNPKDYEDSAVYIKGTSMVLSHIRQAKRDASDGDTKVERSLAFIKQILSLKKWGWFLADEKDLKVWRDYYSKLVNQKSVSEAVIIQGIDAQLPKLSKYNMIIVGEEHSSKMIKYYDKLLSVFKPEYFICEFADEDVCLTQEELADRMKRATNGSYSKEDGADYQYNYWVYELAYKHNCKLIGCNPHSSHYPNTHRSMELEDKYREEFMLDTIRKYDKYRCVVQLGDHHLRSISYTQGFLDYIGETTDDRGVVANLTVSFPSHIYIYYKDEPKALIMRTSDAPIQEAEYQRLIMHESMAGTIGAALPQIASPADYKKGKVYIIKPKMHNNVFDYGVTDDYTLGEAVIINKKTDKAEVISCTKLPSTRFDIFEVKSPEKASELWNRAKELVKSQKPAKDSFYEGFTDDQIYYDENYIQVPGFDEELLKESTNIKELILYGTTLDSVEKSVNEFARLTNG